MSFLLRSSFSSKIRRMIANRLNLGPEPPAISFGSQRRSIGQLIGRKPTRRRGWFSKLTPRTRRRLSEVARRRFGRRLQRRRVRVLDRPLRPGFPGVRDTVRSIAALAKYGARTYPVRRMARGIRTADPRTVANAFYNIARRNLNYTFDPPGMELVRGTQVLLADGNGDCDDFTVLLSAIGLASGYPTRITVARKKNRPQFHHVYPEFLINGQWTPVDATSHKTYPGDHPADAHEKRSFIIPE